mgnify:CR=1 FL=1
MGQGGKSIPYDDLYKDWLKIEVNESQELEFMEEEKEEEEILKLEGNHSLQKYATGYHILRFVTDNIVSDLIRCQRASNVPRVDEIKKHSLKLY